MLFRPSAAASRGFVLIEVLVAVGVAAALMAVLIRSFSATWSGVSYVREEAEGTLLARSMMSDAIQRDRIAAGTQEGVAGRYAWKLTTTILPVGLAASQPSQQPQTNSETQSNNVLYHLVLVLKGPSGRSNRLDTFEIGPPRQ
jgi:type II secretory pathway pseudopilin PulG